MTDIDPQLSEEHIAEIRRGLLGWFDANRRDLPWRRTRDPYRILVSEVMLQQTQVDRVIPYYERFLDTLPSVEALADAPTSVVITLWAGLGYNRRAVNLQRTAQAVMSEHGGVFPADPVMLRQLPGIGPYTSGAIACFAFEAPVAFLDTNMKRVIHRLVTGPDLPKPTLTDRQLMAFAEQLVPPDDAWRWNQALIEFGALQCTARRPACVICPLQAACAAFPAIQSVIATLPPGTRKKQEAPFQGSNRYYRGRVVDSLRAAAGAELALSQLGPQVRDDYAPEHKDWLLNLVSGLQRDGLARIAEPKATYSTAENDEPLVSLP
ncbi:MAG: A/G-specific adenine glycosylase [Thermomicrobiales bacterium]|nr:A/G-specific adenine glycosylase [Thermomicrobiales bacterium]